MRVIKGDITTLEVDAIVNAANRSLLGGGGVDGAIHKAAGPKLLEQCRKLGGCLTGMAKITPGYSLPAKYIIHTVGPVYYDGRHDEPAKLADCYRNCIRLAREYELKSIAFPCVSTGAYRFPVDDAAEIAVRTLRQYCRRNRYEPDIIFCCFQAAAVELYNSLLADAQKISFSKTRKTEKIS
jgi:O-acetyl-ADP-ribose deacetylase